MTIPVDTAVQVLSATLELALVTVQKAQVVGAAIQQAKDEGRAHLTDAEWMNIQKLDDDARQRQVDAINAAT